MKNIISNIHFKLMSLVYKVRDKYLPHSDILKAAGLKQGYHVIDYGCGPGGYIAAASKIIGKTGQLYAVDINPLAIKCVNKLIIKNNLTNIKTILTDYQMNLPDKSIDMVYLFDFFHELKNPEPIINEIYRVLKNNALFSLYDPIMKQAKLISIITDKNLFKLISISAKTCNFQKM